MSLAQSLERAATALERDEDRIRPANGDPTQLLGLLGGEAAVRVLGWLLANEPDAGAELALAWLDEASGPEAIGGVDEAALPKAGLKALRRVRHRARSKGVALSAPAAAERTKVARLPAVEESISAGYVCPYDPRGGRLVYLLEAHPAGGARLYEALLDELRGIVDFQAYRTGRSQVREFVKNVTKRGHYAAVRVEPAAVRALIAATLKRHATDRPLPKAFQEWRGKVLAGADDGVTPGQQVREACTNAEAGEADVAVLVARIEAGELGPWPPLPEDLATATLELRDRLQVQKTSGQEIDRAALDETLREAVAELHGREGGDALATRLEETAFLQWQADAPALAGVCLDAADRLRAGDAEGHALLDAFIERVARELRAQLAPEEPPEAEAAADDD